MAKYSMDKEEYYDKIDPDVTADEEANRGETPDDVTPVPLDSPYVGQLGDDQAEKAREEINEWNEKNDVEPSHEQ